MPNINRRDLLGGCLIIAIGLYFLVSSFSYQIGTAGAMGPGYIPAVLAGLTTVLGIAILAGSLHGALPLPQVEWRAGAFILGSIAAFALGLKFAGFVPAIAATIIVASLARPKPNWRRTLILTVVATLLVWLLFRVGLHLPTPAFRGTL